ncbi:MAG: glycosyltransferase family 2 protein [Anaerolineae bacterium]|nr:glycosyltransferase [Candidatus Roseilinea sp.]MDW8450924.1 glycosyltransferase family 2 protein [Anaerolineae bacterium]
MLAVIIVSWNVRDLLRACLASLIADLSNAGIPSRIIVVDSASADGTPAMVQAEFPSVELIACDQNIGYVKGNNLALRSVCQPASSVDQANQNSQFLILNSRFTWLLNPDTVIHPGAAKALLDFMQAHPRCGLCGPKLLNSDGSLQHGAFALPGLVQLALETQPVLWRFRNTQLDGRYRAAQYDGPPFRVGHPLGAAMFARVEAIRQVGLLDEGFEMYAEEVDWAMRMRKAGWEIWCVPQSVVTHYGGASSGQASERAERLKWRSRQRYYHKHYSLLKRWLAMRLVPAQYRLAGDGTTD